MPILGAALQESLDIGIELGLKFLAQLIWKLVHGLRKDHVSLIERAGLVTLVGGSTIVASHVASRLILDSLCFSPAESPKKYVDIEDDPKPTHQQDLGRPKRLHTTCNAARTRRNRSNQSKYR